MTEDKLSLDDISDPDKRAAAEKKLAARKAAGLTDLDIITRRDPGLARASGGAGGTDPVNGDTTDWVNPD